MSWARTGLDPITMAASAHASKAPERIAAPVLFVPGKGRAHSLWERPSLAQRAALHNGAKKPRHGSAGASNAERRRPPARRHSGLARSWPGRSQVRVAYLKLELSVLLKPAKDLRLPPMLFLLVLTLWKRRTLS